MVIRRGNVRVRKTWEVTSTRCQMGEHGPSTADLVGLGPAFLGAGHYKTSSSDAACPVLA